MAEVMEGRRRTVELRLKLAPTIAEEFGAVAESRGLVPATLAAVVLGEYLESQRQKLQVQRMVAVDMGKRMSEFSFNEELLGKAIAEAMQNPELLKLFAGSTDGSGAG
jgi:hypothetical protein